MADKYSSTLLAQSNEPAEVQKADLDLLRKINEVNTALTDSEAASVASLQAQIDALKAGSYAPGLWLPYPAGTYVFPSGNQTVAEGVLAVGAVTTAPTFGNGSSQKAWYKSNGNKTIDIMISILQPTATGAANGTGFYRIAMPLGITLDSSFYSNTSNNYDGSSIGIFGFRAIISGTGVVATASAVVVSSSLIEFVVSDTTTGGGANANVWGSTFIQPSTTSSLAVTGIISNIPIA